MSINVRPFVPDHGSGRCSEVNIVGPFDQALSDFAQLFVGEAPVNLFPDLFGEDPFPDVTVERRILARVDAYTAG